MKHDTPACYTKGNTISWGCSAFMVAQSQDLVVVFFFIESNVSQVPWSFKVKVLLAVILPKAPFLQLSEDFKKANIPWAILQVTLSVLAALLCYIVTVGGIIEREHIPPKHPSAWRPILTPWEAPSFQLSPQQGPRQDPPSTDHLELWTHFVHSRPPPSMNKSFRDTPPPLHYLHMQVWGETRAKRTAAHVNSGAHLVSGHTVISRQFQPGVRVFCFNRPLRFCGQGQFTRLEV